MMGNNLPRHEARPVWHERREPRDPGQGDQVHEGHRGRVPQDAQLAAPLDDQPEVRAKFLDFFRPSLVFQDFFSTCVLYVLFDPQDGPAAPQARGLHQGLCRVCHREDPPGREEDRQDGEGGEGGGEEGRRGAFCLGKDDHQEQGDYKTTLISFLPDDITSWIVDKPYIENQFQTKTVSKDIKCNSCFMIEDIYEPA